MDAETQDVMQEGEAISDFVKNKAWHIIKAKISDKMLDLQSVMNVKKDDPVKMAIEVEARQLAASYLFEILKDVEGQAAQHDANKPLAQDAVQVI